MIDKNYFIAILFTFVLCPCLPAQNSNEELSEDSLLIGIWIAEEDSLSKLVFTEDKKCYSYYDNELISIETFLISNSSPQCGEKVRITAKTSYLSMINQETKEQSCYEIFGITDKTLSISYLFRGGAPTIFLRQISNRE